jgi:sarcosine oxidase subunit delta
MLLIPCPHCGDRPEIEFRYAGQAHINRAERPAELDDDQWVAFLYHRTNPRGLHFERWRHVFGCARFFNCVRDTLSDEIVATYKAGEPQPDPTGLIADSGL